MDMMAEVPEYGKAAPSPPIPKRLLPKTFDWSNVAGVRMQMLETLGGGGVHVL